MNWYSLFRFGFRNELDKISNKILNIIIQILLSMIYNKKNIFSMEIDKELIVELGKYNDAKIYISVIFIMNEKENIKVQSVYNTNHNYIDLKTVVSCNEFSKNKINDIYYKNIKNIRHEIEHVFQNYKNELSNNNIFPMNKLLKGRTTQDGLLFWYSYMINTFEMDANIRGIMLLAKKEHKQFDYIVESYILDKMTPVYDYLIKKFNDDNDFNKQFFKNICYNISQLYKKRKSEIYK